MDATTYEETDTCWHILTHFGGNVSILKNLDAPTARAVYRKLTPGCPFRTEDGRVETLHIINLSDEPHMRPRVEIIGPEGAELDPWRGVDPKQITPMPKAPAP